MGLYALDLQFSGERTATAIFNHVAQLIDGSRFSNYAVVDFLPSLFKKIAHDHSTIIGRTFFIASN